MIVRTALFSILMLCFSSCYVTKCPNKNDFITGFKEFTSKTEENPPEDWATADKEFYQYMNECYSMYAKELTNEEKGKLWLYAAGYYSEKYEGRIDKGFDEAKEKLKPEVLDDFEKFMETYPEELLRTSLGRGIKVLSKFLRGVSKEIKPELEKLGEELKKTTKELSEELEKIEVEK